MTSHKYGLSPFLQKWIKWNIANDVSNPRKETPWNIVQEDGKTINDEEDVAEPFNDFFIEKVEQLKKNSM